MFGQVVPAHYLRVISSGSVDLHTVALWLGAVEQCSVDFLVPQGRQYQDPSSVVLNLSLKEHQLVMRIHVVLFALLGLRPDVLLPSFDLDVDVHQLSLRLLSYCL